MIKLVNPPLFFLLLLWSMAPNYASADAAGPSPITTVNPNISLEELDIIAAPLLVEELKIEADGWLKLIKASAQNVAKTKVRIRHLKTKQTQAEEKANKLQLDSSHSAAIEAQQKRAIASAEKFKEEKTLAMDELTKLRNERTDLIDRLVVILDRINQKIGLDDKGQEKEEVLVYRRYINAVGGIKMYTSDFASGFTSIKGWLLSEQGGKRWAINFAKFVVIIIVFWILGKILGRLTQKGLKFSGKNSILLSEFLVGMTSRVVFLVGILVALSALEINLGPLLAFIGAAGFVVAFALQNTLSNFASGIMIMLYRPFDVDDVVEVAGISGKVVSLNLVTTTITTFDNKHMVVPNNDIWGNIITNATISKERRVDMVFGIGYQDDIHHALQVLEDIVSSHSLILKNPAPVIQLHELADSSVNFICRPWVKTGDYWTVYWDVTRSVKERFDAEGLTIPFPQRDVHVYQELKSMPHDVFGTSGEDSE